MPEKPPLAQLRALVKGYGPLCAIDRVELAVGPGEIVGLLGPNGAGKTTLLECLLGLRTPDAGEVRLDGIDVARDPRSARRRVGAQIQPAALQEKITPREALRFQAAFHEDPEEVEALLERFDLTAKAGAHFDTLSAGQRQRLALALAFVNRPTLLVLDEPTLGLDPPTRRALHLILSAHRAAGGAVLLSTHDLDEAQRLCDRVAILHRGRILADAAPATLIDRLASPTRIVFETTKPFIPPSAAVLGTISPTDGGPRRFELRSTEPARAVVAITQAIHAAGNELAVLQVLPPSLEDAFVALTGEPWDRVELSEA